MIAEINGRSSVAADGGAVLVSHATPIPESGWPFRPFQIVSLLDMNRVFLSRLDIPIDALREMERIMSLSSPSNVEIPKEWDERLRLIARLINENFRTPLGILRARDDVSIRFSRFLVRINGHSRDEGGRTIAAVWGEARALREALEDALSKHTFMHILPEDGAYFDQHELFGPEVANRFPEANKEIIQAGNCFAIESYTACVFHLMRAVEIGARVMVSSLKVQKHLLNHNKKRMPVELCDWQTLINALQKGVDAKAVGVSTDTRKKATYEFYNHALASFRNFKDAWRNHVAHTRELYQAGRAKDVLDNTRQFMQHLAIRLKE